MPRDRSPMTDDFPAVRPSPAARSLILIPPPATSHWPLVTPAPVLHQRTVRPCTKGQFTDSLHRTYNGRVCCNRSMAEEAEMDAVSLTGTSGNPGTDYRGRG